jgi:hypothetical protein
MDVLQDYAIEELIASPVGQKLRQAIEVVESVQSHVAALMQKDEEERLTLLKIGTVFQLFLIDTLASGKKASELTADDWKNIAAQVSQNAILEEDQCYSEYAFSRYADYIRVSAKVISKNAPEETTSAITALADEIEALGDQLHKETITETKYVEECLWLSLEAMVKLLSASLGAHMGEELSKLTQAVSQLAFEYGRYVLYAKERALLEAYLNNQRVLDDQLQRQYDAFIQELQENATQFQSLIDKAFSPDIRCTLQNSAELAQATGVKKEDILKSIEEVDSFFLA